MKPRIGIYYDAAVSGRNDGAPLYYKNILDNLAKEGIIGECLHVVPDGKYKHVGKLDLAIWVDWGEDALMQAGMIPYELVLPDCPIAYVSSDTHLGPGYRFEMANKADYVFFNQKEAVDTYVPSFKNKTFEWLPHAFEPSCYRPGVWSGAKWVDAVPKKEWDVCFVGHMQNRDNGSGMNRLDALDRLFKEFPNFYLGTRSPYEPGRNLFDDAAAKFNRSRCVFNISIGGEANMRLFEALGTRSALLTDRFATLPFLFKEDEHLFCYSTYDEMVEKAGWIITHPEESSAVAAAGYQEAITNHTYRHRVLRVLEVAGVLPPAAS